VSPDSVENTLTFNTGLADRLRGGGGAELAGSVYAVPARDRASVARELARQRAWVHADVFADARHGVSLDLIGELAATGVAPIDVHLLTAGALESLDAVCRPGVTRVTVPFEGLDDVETVAARIRASGVRPWLAISPGTTLSRCADALAHVDGLLVMLLEPGSRGRSDLTHLAKVAGARERLPVGVDGGVGEADVDRVLAAGAGYVVVGRQLLLAPTAGTSGSATTTRATTTRATTTRATTTRATTTRATTTRATTTRATTTGNRSDDER
jgi:pentose-5-phosphate-3-epimerase